MSTPNPPAWAMEAAEAVEYGDIFAHGLSFDQEKVARIIAAHAPGYDEARAVIAELRAESPEFDTSDDWATYTDPAGILTGTDPRCWDRDAEDEDNSRSAVRDACDRIEAALARMDGANAPGKG